MRKVDMAAAYEFFDRNFRAAEQTMFKAEVLQDYTGVDDGPSLHAWRDGNIADSKRLYLEDKASREWISACQNSPAEIIRIHIVRYPLSDYMRWEIETVYKLGLMASNAETVYLADAATLNDVSLPDGDFWIFDGKKVIKFDYAGAEGRLVGAAIYDKNDNIEPFTRAKDVLLKFARPLY